MPVAIIPNVPATAPKTFQSTLNEFAAPVSCGDPTELLVGLDAGVFSALDTLDELDALDALDELGMPVSVDEPALVELVLGLYDSLNGRSTQSVYS